MLNFFISLQRVSYSGAYLKVLLHTANVVEFEWIRQYFVQGSRHRQTHLWWQEPMQELVDLWHELRKKTVLALEVLQDAAGMSMYCSMCMFHA